MAFEQRSPKISSLFSIFILDQRVSGHTARTVETYQERLGPFFGFLNAAGIKNAGEVAPNHIRQYINSLQERGLAGYTVHGAARVIRAFFNFAVREEMIASSPMEKIRMPKLPKKNMPIFSDGEVARLLAVCDTHRDRAMVKMAAPALRTAGIVDARQKRINGARVWSLKRLST
jgi:site-specific recombinase XerD